MKPISIFWGCTIPARFPFIEQATRLVVADLGGEVNEVAGFTCCPEGALVKTADEHVFYLAAARNLACALRVGSLLVTPCNGCYATFKETQAELKINRERFRTLTRAAEHVMTAAAREGEGSEEAVGVTASALAVTVKHFAEWLHDELGPAGLAKRVTHSLSGMRIAVHYGCHLLRPSPAVRWDSPTEPTKLEDLVRALGALVVDYETKMDCCGGALDRVGERDGALAMCRRKLQDVSAHGVDALVVVCPSCFQQFDLNQAALVRAGDDLHVPVFHLSELLALAFGRQAGEIGLAGHRSGVDGFLSRLREQRAIRDEVGRRFNVKELDMCVACRACEADCPVAAVQPGFSPTAIIGEILAGDLDGVIERGVLWSCVECYTCYERCHSRLGMAEVFRALKRLAQRQGDVPPAVTRAYETFLHSGRLAEPREAARAKLGLSPLPASGAEELKEMVASLGDAEGGA
jgi:heterodisulfide reductase subunit B